MRKRTTMAPWLVAGVLGMAAACADDVGDPVDEEATDAVTGDDDDDDDNVGSDSCDPGYVACTTGCCHWQLDDLGSQSVPFAAYGVIEHQGAIKIALVQNETIHIASWDEAGWTFEDTGIERPELMAIALSPDDGPMLSINPPGSTGDLLVASSGPGGWETEYVETDEGIELIFGHGDLQFAPDGTPNLLYLYSPSAGIRVMHNAWNGAQWDSTWVTDYGNSNYSLALDSAGEPHITLFDTHFSRQGASWTDVPFDVSSQFADLEIDAMDRPHVCRRKTGPDDVGPTLYHYVLDGTWQAEAVDDTNRAGETCSVKLDSADRPHITYCSSCTGDFDTTLTVGFDDIRHAWRDGDQWHISTVTEFGWAKLLSSFVDSEDRAHVLYYDMSESTFLTYEYRLMHAVLTP